MVKKILFWFLGIYFAIAALGGVVVTVSDLGEYRAFFAVFTIVLLVASYFLIKAARRSKTTSKKEIQLRQLRIEQVNSMATLPVVQNVRFIILKPGEVCHYQAAATTMLAKNEVVGHTNGYRGASIRVAKGLTLHTGGGRGQAIRQNIIYRYPGMFTITSQRIIMTGEKGFDNQIEKLTALTTYIDGVTLQFGNSTYTILMDEPYWVEKIFDLLRSGAPIKSDSSPLNSKDIVEIRERIDEGSEVETPEDTELSYLDAKALDFWNGKRTDFEVPKYYSESAFGRNVSPALQRLLDAGYLKLGDIEERISLKTIPELKAILTDRELKTSGNKKELVYRLWENLDENVLDELFPVNVYKVTEKGKKALEPYSIIKDNDDHALGLSYYRLLKAKEKAPDDENNIILTRLLSEDIQQCYKDQNRSKYQLCIEKTARFMREIGELDSSFECYSLAFFMWTMNIKEHGLNTIGGQTFYMAKSLEESGKLCGYSLKIVISTFQNTIKRVNPFALGTIENIGFSIQNLKDSLGV